MPTKLVKISRRAFKGCSSLSSIILPFGTESIELDAFADCSSLARIAIPRGIKELDEETFFGCDSLTDVSFGGTRERWESLLGGRALTLQRSDLSISTPKVTFMNIE